MKTTAAALLGAICVWAAPKPDVDTMYPYTGPTIPIGDWVDPTVNGNGKGYPRLVEPPAVNPKGNATNNINVISLSYIPSGVNVHFQTAFGLNEQPTVFWGEAPKNLTCMTKGQTTTYDRTPPCSLVSATQCSQFFHDVQIDDLKPDTTYFYQIAASNGTTQSDVLKFKTPPATGDKKSFTMAVLNDMGYTNADGTYKYLLQAATEEEIAFAWHGGDMSYADDWYDGILPCEDDWPVCYNGSSTELPPGDYPEEYNSPLPAGENANQGGPLGGDMSVIYESNWDLWQQWTNKITTKIPYMVLPGNHDVTCGEYDGPGNVLTAYLTDGIANGTAAAENLTYYSCPPSQRNFTAFQHRFRMPGKETGGVNNFWYSFDYGMAHFIALDAETDFANSPSWTFARDIAESKTPNETHPTISETFITDSGPFGEIEGNRFNDNKAYEQYKFLVKDLQGVDRTKTPWVIVMSHRPMYSTQTSSYQAHIRAAWEDVMLKYEVDVYLAGHIHWYERLFPLGVNGTIDTASIVDNSTFYTNPGKSMTHIINGMAGNVESHSTLDEGETQAAITAVLDDHHYGFSKLTVEETELKWQFIMGHDGSIGDELTLKKKKVSAHV
ncbi:Acid phosphatase [Cytospora mali]|uniref:Purple acid phosphatase n=1 Tax=Cytospora mali TaxID=578113 RepID=A0A194W7P8_CYTMA|nr:Acid phosphatase [Valsa mali]